jgi:hypothetical protein
VGPEWSPLSLVSTTEELLGRNSRGSSLEFREYGRWDPLRRPRDKLYPQKLALGIVRSQTKVTEFILSNFPLTIDQFIYLFIPN